MSSRSVSWLLTFATLALLAFAVVAHRSSQRARGLAAARPALQLPRSLGQPVTRDGCRLSGLVVGQSALHPAVADAVVALSRVGSAPPPLAPAEQPTIAMADGDGRWGASLPEPGRYSLRVSSASHAPATLERDCCAGCREDLITTELEPGAIPLTGAVSSVLREPLAGALVLARRLPIGSKQWLAGAFAAVVDAAGSYALQLRPGEYALEILRRGYAREVVSPVRVQPGGARRDVALLPAGVISGRVLERATGEGVAGVLVSAHGSGAFGMHAWDGPSVVSDSRGQFKLEGVRPGDVELTARGAELTPRDPLRLALAWGTESQGATLWADAGRKLAGIVVAKSDPNRALSGVWVDARDVATGASAPSSALTAADGRFEVRGLHAGTYALDIYGPSQALVQSELRIQVADQDVQELRVPIEAGFSVEGRVEPATEAVVLLRAAASGADHGQQAGELVGQASEDGSFALRGVASGDFVLIAEAGDGRQGTIDVHVEDQDQGQLVVRLLPQASIAGQALDDRGKPIEDARVVISRASPSLDLLDKLERSQAGDPRLYGEQSPDNVFRYVQVAADGRFEARGLPAGDYDLRVWDRFGARAWSRSSLPRTSANDRESRGLSEEQRVEAPLRVTLEDSETRTSLKLTVRACDAAIRGKVTDSKGAPLAGAWVFARAFERGAQPLDVEVSRAARSLADGSFNLPELCPATYQIETSSADGTRRGRKIGVHPGAGVAVKAYPLAELSGLVTQGGQPVSDYVLSLSGPQDRHQAVHAADGRFRLSALETSEYALTVEAEQGYVATSIAVIPERKRELKFELVPYASVSGTVVDNRQAPMAGVEIKLLLASDAGPSGFESMVATRMRVREAITDDTGQFAIDRLLARSGQILLFAEQRRLFVARTKFLSPLGRLLGSNAIVEIETRPGETLELGALEVRSNDLKR